MNLRRTLALESIEASNLLTRERDFLGQLGIATPVPFVPGALPALAREPFAARDLKRLMDLMVVFVIGDFPDHALYSSYFDPASPWFNTFYGAYGVHSYKRDGAAWGFDTSKNPLIDELLQVPFIDYNFLTAGELGCPPDKMCFEVLERRDDRVDGWVRVEARARIPSGLARRSDAAKPNLEYDLVFGTPPEELLGRRASYEPVEMVGTLHFKAVHPRITLVWGGMCPDTADGRRLLTTITDAMKPGFSG